jgi:Protein of unknown function (DUF3386)
MSIVKLSARDLFRAAYENRYTWDGGFPGYRATVTLHHGDQTYTAKAQVNADLSTEVSDIADEEMQKLIKGQLWEVAIHRVRRSFEETHGKNEFSYGANDGEPGADGAVEILVGGKSAGDKYKVRDNEVVLVHRHIHGVVVTINTLETIDTGEGYLSRRYDSVYHDPQTGEQKKAPSSFIDEYEQVGDYFILNRRVMDASDAPKVEFLFTEIESLA